MIGRDEHNQGQIVARRLPVEQRREEIIAGTREMIALEGPSGLSIRKVARYCGMSAPGVLHHFPDLTSLLNEVLMARDIDELNGIHALFESGEEQTLRALTNAAVAFIAERPVETRNFDLMEAEAADPTHPAHAYFARRREHTGELSRRLAEEEFEDPDLVLEMLNVFADGLRTRWLASDVEADYVGDWNRIADQVFASFKPRKGAK